jgi:hypothetical protein
MEALTGGRTERKLYQSRIGAKPPQALGIQQNLEFDFGAHRSFMLNAWPFVHWHMAGQHPLRLTVDHP